MAGLGNLFDGTGGTALDSYNSGVDTALDQQKQLLANQNSAAMNPLNAQFRQGEIARQDAELPGIVGQSQQQGAAGEIAQATKLDAIKQRQTELASKASESELEQGRQFGERMMQLSQHMNNVPPPARAAFLVQQAEKMGISKDNPQLQALLSTPPEGMPKILYETGKGVAESSAKFLQERALGDQKGGYSVQTANIAADASRYAADRSAEARTADANKPTPLNAEKRLVQLMQIPPEQRDANWQREVRDVAEVISLTGQAKIPSITPDILDGKTPQNNAARVETFNDRVGAKGDTKPKPTQGIEQMVKEAGGSYEPDKYFYRVGPDGKVQRAPK